MSELLKLCKKLEAEAKQRGALGRAYLPGTRRFNMIGTAFDEGACVTFHRDSFYDDVPGDNYYCVSLHFRDSYSTVIAYLNGDLHERKNASAEVALAKLRKMAISPFNWTLYGQHDKAGELMAILHTSYLHLHDEPHLGAWCPVARRPQTTHWAIREGLVPGSYLLETGGSRCL